MKKVSIGKKVSSLTIRISLVAVLAVGIIAITGLWILRENTVKISSELGETAASDSQTALEEQMTDRLAMLVKNRVGIIDLKLQAVQNSVEMIAQGAEEIVQNPGLYNPNPADAPNAENKGSMTAQFLRAENTDFSDIEKEAALMGNIQGLLLNIINNNIDATTNYIGSENGYIIIVDEVPDTKATFFDPRERPWYKLATQNNALSWTDIYADAYGRGFTITCAKPYYSQAGQIEGVAGVGIVLNELTEIVVESKIGESGYAFMLNELGQVIISGELEADADGNILREDLLNSQNAELAVAVQNMIEGKSGIERVNMDGKQYFIAYSALDTLPWSLATVIEVNEAVFPAIESGKSIIAMKDSALKDINLIIIIIVAAFVVIIALTVPLIGYWSRRFSGTLTKPITELQLGVREIAGGNLEHVISIHSGDEIEDLGISVNKMSLDLKDYIASLQAVTAEKERVGAELNVATKIQASMLPCIFPAFPDRPEFDIYATMIPAKEVGGDFYDFFMIDDDKLAVVMADVSGKGVPAALFMVIAKTLIKNNAQYGKDPREVFETVNDLLCENNEANMFVTAFMGILEISTGQFNYVNAGHNPPLIKRKDGNYEWLPTKPGFVLAGMEGMRYKQDEITLNDGDCLYMYTDGVTEAVNPKNELFSEPKLKEIANQYKESPLKGFVSGIKTEIDLFADGAEQADDITMLILKMTGGAK